MAGGQKKVIVRLVSGDAVSGYLPSSDLSRAGEVSMLDPGGRIISLRMSEIKMIAYVRDFNLQDSVDPERLGKRTFPARPRAEGLWVRLSFRDGDLLEGLGAADMGLLDGLLEDGGIFLTPPDTRSNTQRVFVPRSAMAGMELLGLIRPAAPKAVRARAIPVNQPGLFEE